MLQYSQKTKETRKTSKCFKGTSFLIFEILSTVIASWKSNECCYKMNSVFSK